MYGETALKAAHPDIREMAPLMIQSWVQQRGVGETERLIEAQIHDPRRTEAQRAAWRIFSNELEHYRAEKCFSDEYRRSRRFPPTILKGAFTTLHRSMRPLEFRDFQKAWKFYLTIHCGWEE